MTEHAAPRTVTLSSLKDGAAEELFAAAFAKVLENVDDPNTEARARRSITITVSVRPDENRRVAKVGISCSTKLAGVAAIDTTVFLGMNEGALAAVEAIPQEEMFPQQFGRPQKMVAATTEG